MLKAVFVDYTGTLIEEGGKDMQQLISRCSRNSRIESPEKMVAYWWKLLKELEDASYGPSYRTEDEIVDLILQTCVKEIGLRDNLEELHDLCRRFWMYAPAFDDVKEFFRDCPLPIFVISNNGLQYVEEGMRHKDFHPAGIVCADMVRAYKPHRELFEKALEISGFRAEEAVHIGDSITSDVKGALSAGICPLLLDRKDKTKEKDLIVVRSLKEATSWIHQKLNEVTSE